MATKIVYVGPFPAGAEIADTGHWVTPGDTVEVDDGIAGRPPSGVPGEEHYDAGAGLLAQVANFIPAGSAAGSAATITEVLAEVGDDPSRAAAAAAAERARGADARPTLLTKLDAIASPQTGDKSNG